MAIIMLMYKIINSFRFFIDFNQIFLLFYVIIGRYLDLLGDDITGLFTNAYKAKGVVPNAQGCLVFIRVSMK